MQLKQAMSARVLGCWKWVANFHSGTLAQSVWQNDCGCEYCSTVGKKDKDAETGAAALYDNLQSMQVHWSDTSQHLPGWWTDTQQLSHIKKINYALAYILVKAVSWQ